MIRALLPLLLLAAHPSPSMPRPAAWPTLAADADERWVPFETTAAGQVRFAMEIDGRTVTAILDTGVSDTVLARRSAAFDPARTRGGGRAEAVGGRVALARMAFGRLALGGMVRTNGEVAVADLPDAATGGGADLLVGRDLVGGYALDIDYPARRFRLLPSGRLPFAGAVAPLTISARGVYETAATLGARRLAPVIVDTGDGGQWTVTDAAWRASGIAAPVTTALSHGVGGPETTGLAVIAGAMVGEAAPGAAEVRIEGPGGLSQRIGVAGRIGSGLLARFRVLLDPGAGRMLMRRAAATPPPARSTSGLLLEVGRDRLRVLHVMHGGPAAAAGWRAGEEVCRVDDVAVGVGHAAGWTVGEPGRSVSLQLCDGARRRLTLQQFY